jgi:hypothetical protein
LPGTGDDEQTGGQTDSNDRAGASLSYKAARVTAASVILVALIGLVVAIINATDDSPESSPVPPPRTPASATTGQSTASVTQPVASATDPCNGVVQALFTEEDLISKLRPLVILSQGQPIGFASGYREASAAAVNGIRPLTMAVSRYKAAKLMLPSDVALAPQDLNQIRIDLQNLTEYVIAHEKASDEYGALKNWADKLSAWAGELQPSCPA